MIEALAVEGQHRGGVSVPGPRLVREALYREIRQIPPEPGEARLFGRSTREWGLGRSAARSRFGHRGIIERMSAEHGPGARLLTGGDAETVLPCLRGEYRWEPDLISKRKQT